VMAAAARARAAGRITPSEPVVTITEARVQLSDDPPPTSLAAAMDVLPRTGTQRRQVLDALLDAYRRGYGGATDPELQRHLRMSPNSQRPRRVELVDAGLVHDSGVTRAHQGHAHAVWAPTAIALQSGA